MTRKNLEKPQLFLNDDTPLEFYGKERGGRLQEGSGLGEGAADAGDAGAIIEGDGVCAWLKGDGVFAVEDDRFFGGNGDAHFGVGAEAAGQHDNDKVGCENPGDFISGDLFAALQLLMLHAAMFGPVIGQAIAFICQKVADDVVLFCAGQSCGDVKSFHISEVG